MTNVTTPTASARETPSTVALGISTQSQDTNGASSTITNSGLAVFMILVAQYIWMFMA